MIKWFNSRESAVIGADLADALIKSSKPAANSADARLALSPDPKLLQEVLGSAAAEIRALRLNFYKKAKLANSFKWRLLEAGVEEQVANQLTQEILLRVSAGAPAVKAESGPIQDKTLLALGTKRMAQGNYAAALESFETLLGLHPRSPVALNNTGAAMCKIGRYKDAEPLFRSAIEVAPNYPDAYNNLGTLLRWLGRLDESESFLRSALKLKPNFVEARSSLGMSLILLGRPRDAKARFAKVLKASPRNVDAMVGLAQVATIEGRFDDARKSYERALKINARTTSAWVGLSGLRRMTREDSDWLKNAEDVASSSDLTPIDEASINYAIGKFFDDVDEFQQAFTRFKRANELQKSLALTYDRRQRTELVDGLVSSYNAATFPDSRNLGSHSNQPIFVTGMMRSGTSLVEQILASHPAVKAAGELEFWANAGVKRNSDFVNGILGPDRAKSLAAAYLGLLSAHGGASSRIVDKTPANADYLGLIHSVFPNARIIYMQRDPIDVCLSCYFQQFSPALNYAMDLSDLAHYYREHDRLMSHWRSILPKGSMLDVPYDGLVTDQAGWTKRILDFLSLEWDERCLSFHETKRFVSTASYWQVRQKIYSRSVGRWRKYKSFIRPLLPFEKSGT